MQLTLRIDPALAADLKLAAQREGQSVNAFATAVLGAVVDPDFAGTQSERIRERLARAGLLATDLPEDNREPIDADALRAARRAAARGTSLSDLVHEDRR